MLDTVLVNCVLLYRKVTNSNISSKEFRLSLAWELIKEALGDEKKKELLSDEMSSQTPPKGKRVVHVTKNFELPLTRLLDEDHLVEWMEKREACVYCRYKSQRGEKVINYDNPSQSQLWCSKCKVPLCCSKARPYCFRDYHSKIQE
ncbi:11774_t:CDS:1 [Scutellospora calospora]|uniref:11774_t:CDS:1 n=1 Tax=Scutellospora calospora TaxID=85575 RepID=A0ACA9K484_9GLOM|nr:11774_t:CDS:1 [Scutellospora calospora]